MLKTVSACFHSLRQNNLSGKFVLDSNEEDKTLYIKIKRDHEYVNLENIS